MGFRSDLKEMGLDILDRHLPEAVGGALLLAVLMFSLISYSRATRYEEVEKCAQECAPYRVQECRETYVLCSKFAKVTYKPIVEKTEVNNTKENGNEPY